ncbi:MAG: hypothetical protein C0604_06775 [Clostridiales bacterium]|nr:MAG: hypothetical protein C0604_06775 [Clostridiales bacterium]
MIKNKMGIILLLIVVVFGSAVLYNIYEGRDLDLSGKAETVSVSVVYEGPVEIGKAAIEGQPVFKSGIESEGRIVSVEKAGDSYRIIASIPVTKSGPYMKFGSQSVKMGNAFVLEGQEFYFEGYIALIEAGVENEG